MKVTTFFRRYCACLVLAGCLLGIVTGGAQASSARQSGARASELCVKADSILAHVRSNKLTSTEVQALWREARDLYIESAPIWAEIGDFRREALAWDRVSNLSYSLKDWRMWIDAEQRQLEIWTRHDDVDKQVCALSNIGDAYRNLGDLETAETYMRKGISLAESARLGYRQGLLLGDLEYLYRTRGEREKALQCERSWQALQKQGLLSQPERDKPPPTSKPAGWIDIPSCPMVSKYRAGENDARDYFLKNRSKNAIEYVALGCITSEGGRIRAGTVVLELSIDDSAIGPGAEISSLFDDLNGPANEWADTRRECAESGNFSVIYVLFTNGSVWRADGRTWPESSTDH